MKHTYIADDVYVEINSNFGFAEHRLPLGAHGVEVERTEPNEFGAVLITTECDCDQVYESWTVEEALERDLSAASRRLLFAVLDAKWE